MQRLSMKSSMRDINVVFCDPSETFQDISSAMLKKHYVHILPQQNADRIVD